MRIDQRCERGRREPRSVDLVDQHIARALFLEGQRHGVRGEPEHGAVRDDAVGHRLDELGEQARVVDAGRVAEVGRRHSADQWVLLVMRGERALDRRG